MFVWWAPWFGSLLQSAKPPWNHPQLTPFALSRSPMFLLFGSVDVEVSRVSHLSPVGCGSPIMVWFGVTATPNEVASGVKPCVWPLTRLIAPTDDGPNVVPNELSL